MIRQGLMTAVGAGAGTGTGTGAGRNRQKQGRSRDRGTGAWTGVTAGTREIFYPLCVFMYSSERKFCCFLHIHFLRTVHCTYVCEDKARIHSTGYEHVYKFLKK